MIVHKTHKIRLQPNNKQANYFAQACGCSRLAYNWGLSEWKRQYEAGERPSAFKLDKQFNAIKRDLFPFITNVTKCAPQRSFKDLGTAFKNFFRNVKAGKKPGYPRFKRRGMRDSFYLANDTFKLKGNRIRIPKLDWVKMRECLRFPGKIVSAVVSRTADQWHVSIQVEVEVPEVAPPRVALGVDVGIKELAVVSDGRVFGNPRALKKLEPKLRRAQKAVSRKKKGSQNRKKAVAKLARLHLRISNIRKDSLHKLTSAITTGVSAIGIEDLNVSGMMKNRRLSKALADSSMSELHRQLEYKAAWRGVDVVKADRFFPSSKKCSTCGNVKKKLALGERQYKCEACSVSLDRDLNAAINLESLAAGSAVTALRLGSSDLVFGRGETTDWLGSIHGSARRM